MEIAESYLAAWNEPDAETRRKLVDEVFATDATLTDPLAEVSGREAITALIEGARAQFPGMTFTLGGAVDRHHHLARFTWHLGPAGAPEPLVVGFDVVELNADGKIRAVHGFLDKVPQG
jgi:hypothetical protein